MGVKPKLPSGKGASNQGQMMGGAEKEKFANPMNEIPVGVPGLDGLHNDIGEMSGFQGSTDAYIVKKGTPYGEAAKFNFLPPGMDISNQENKDIRGMPMKKVTDMSYPGDGWEPAPRDIREA